ncbi:hypothetical protein RRG08_057882 [Elysia crispata]|uniref:Major facilitator superfamily (MFS) profile domain-containing protein n=1 Tax=Elysia crispata TaxID=231223 RepID=A0AAE1E979_9GAST|nr:hypothetical protein RRG08_057882 [Elysia crispata]
MSEAGVKDSQKNRDSRGDGPRERSATGGETDRLVSQDGGESVLYTDDVLAPPEVAVEEHIVTREWKAPDGGWGYVVMVSAFIMSVIVDGITYSFGVLLADLEQAFQAPKSEVVLANSIQVGAYLMIGPVASAFTNAFGCRKVILAGTFIAALAFMSSIWSSESRQVSVLVLTYGLVGGIGLGLMYLPTIVAVSLYFDRKRALTTCIAMCGSGIGALVMAPLSEFLLNEFNWRGTIFIQAAIILNGLVFGALVRPLHVGVDADVEVEEESMDKTPAIVKRSKDHVQDYDIVEIREIGRVEPGRLDNAEKHSGKFQKRESRRRSQNRRRSSLAERRGSTDGGHWLVVGRRARRRSGSGHWSARPRGTTIWEAIPGITLTDHDEEKTVVILETQRLKDADPLESEAGTRQRSMSEPGSAGKLQSAPNSRVLRSASHKKSVPHSSRNAAEHQFIQSEPLPGNSQQLRHRTFPHSRTPFGLSFIGLADSMEASHGQMVRSTKSEFTDSEESTRCGNCSAIMGESFAEAMREMLNFTIFKNKSFWLVLAGQFFVLLGLYVPYVYVSDRAVVLGFDETSAAFLISVIGATNVISRAVTGLVMHFCNVNTALATSLALFVASVSIAAYPLVETYFMLSLLSGLFGFSTAVFIALCSLLLCDLLGVNNLANAFGFVVLFRGVSSILGPPLAGAIIDATGRIDEAFFLAGTMVFLGGLSHLVLYVIYMSPCGVKGRRVTYAEEPGTDMAVHRVEESGHTFGGQGEDSINV